MNVSVVPITFVVGSRRVFSVDRRLRTISYSLEQLVAGEAPEFGEPEGEIDGYRCLSVPMTALGDIAARFPGHAIGGLQQYQRRYIAMDGSYSDYMARFSGKTRSTLRRKQRKLSELGSGSYHIEEFRKPAEIEGFLKEAIPLSRLTYQSRLLDAGLPEGPVARAEALELAGADRLRAFLLRLDGQPLAYLYLPVANNTLVYAFLGYDPDHAAISPGTVLQLEALERLFAEQRFRYFDFTEGDGAHKQMFSTDQIEACSFYLLRPSFANKSLLGTLDLFNRGIAKIKKLAERNGALFSIRRMLRT